MLRDDPREAGLEARAEDLEAGVERGAEVRERRERGADGDRIAAERAGLVDGAERGELLHDGALAAVDGQRESASDDLAEAGQVGSEPRPLLHSAPSDAAAGHYLVEDGDGSVRPAERDDLLEEAGDGGTTPMFPTTGSTITAATERPRSAKRVRSAGRSL